MKTIREQEFMKQTKLPLETVRNLWNTVRAGRDYNDDMVKEFHILAKNYKEMKKASAQLTVLAKQLRW